MTVNDDLNYVARTTLKLSVITCGAILIMAGAWNPFHAHIRHPLPFLIGGIVVVLLGIGSLFQK